MSQFNPNTLNGAKCLTYEWTQSRSDIDVFLPVDKEVVLKDVEVKISRSQLQVKIKAQVEIDGTFSHPVDATASFWLFESNQIHIFLEKEQESWWQDLINEEVKISEGMKDLTIPYESLSSGEQDVIRKLQWEQHEKVKQNLNRN